MYRLCDKSEFSHQVYSTSQRKCKAEFGDCILFELCIWFSEKDRDDLFKGRRYYPTTRITKRLLAAGKNDW